MKPKFKALSVVVVIGIGLAFGFQNCSQTRFSQVDKAFDSTSSIVGIGEVNSDGPQGSSGSSESSQCQSVPVSLSSLNVGATAEGHEVIGYRVGEVNCAYTSFLVKVRAYGQFETFLVYRKNHASGQIELISKSAEGYPVFVYEQSVSISADNRYVIYSPHRIVDRSPTPIVPELIHRREISSGRIDVVNTTADGRLVNIFYPEYGFNHKTAESKDGNVVLFRAVLGRGGAQLYKKNMVSGELSVITGNDAASAVDLSYPITSFSISEDAGASLITRQASESIESLLLINLNSQTSIVTGNGTASHYDGVDEKVVGNVIVSANGKYAFFEGDYIGGRRQQERNRQIIRKDLATGQSRVVSVNEQTSQIGYNWQLQSVSKDGRYFCFLSTPSALTEVNAQTLVAEPVLAYVKDIQNNRISLLSREAASSSSAAARLSAPLSSSGCAIDADGLNASYGLGAAVYHSRIIWD